MQDSSDLGRLMMALDGGHENLLADGGLTPYGEGVAWLIEELGIHIDAVRPSLALTAEQNAFLDRLDESSVEDGRMTLHDALDQLEVPRGVTSVISAVRGGDMGSVSEPATIEDGPLDKMLDHAVEQLGDVEEAQRDAGSDPAYWGYEGQRAYWSCVVNLIRAANVIGRNNLPEVDEDPTAGTVVMDRCAHTERFGEAVLQQAKQEARNGEA